MNSDFSPTYYVCARGLLNHVCKAGEKVTLNTKVNVQPKSHLNLMSSRNHSQLYTA